jgi:hypothetical protein
MPSIGSTDAMVSSCELGFHPKNLPDSASLACFNRDTSTGA